MESGIIMTRDIPTDELYGRIMIFQLAYHDLGTVVKLTDDIYGFVDEHSGFSLIDFIHNKVLDGRFNLPFLTDDVIILCRNFKSVLSISQDNNQYCNKSYLIDKETFEVLYETDNFLFKQDDIIYEAYENESTSFDITGRKLFSDSGELIGNIEACGEMSISAIGETGYYIIRSGDIEEDDDFSYATDRHISIYKRTNNRIELMWKSNEYFVTCLSDELVLFSHRARCKNVYVYNFNKKELLKS